MTDPRWKTLVEGHVMGELDAEERRELLSLQDDDARRQEMELLDALGSYLDDAPEVPLSALNPVAEADAVVELRPRRRSWRGAAVVALLAAAAAIGAVVLWPRTPVDAARIDVLEGDVVVDAADAASLVAGDLVRVNEGRACVSFDAGIRACGGQDSVFGVESDRVGDLRLELRRGTLTAQLDAQEPGHRFSIRAGSVRATAVGTVYTVEYDPDRGEVDVRVNEGVIELEVAGSTVSLEAHRRAVVVGERVTLSASEPEMETADWNAIRPGRTSTPARGEAPPSPAAPPRAAPEPGTPDSPPELVEPEKPEDAPPAADETGSSELTEDASAPAPARPARTETAASLLSKARAALGQGRSRRAATLYRDLVERFPKSAEAQASRVALGDLYLHELKKPAMAKRYFDAYLRRGGSLSLQARYGRIVALQKSKRPEAEAKAIEEFIAKHPRSGYVPALKRRLEQLR